MASNLDALLNGTTVSVSGSPITISGLSDNERAILLIALLAYERAFDRALTAGRLLGDRAGRSTGAVETVVITPGNG